MISLATVSNSDTSQSMAQTRTKQAAHEFEAQMMKELLAPMSRGTTLGSSDEEDSDSSSVMQEYAADALGKGISAQGGFGMADRILRDLYHSGNQPQIGKVTTK